MSTLLGDNYLDIHRTFNQAQLAALKSFSEQADQPQELTYVCNPGISSSHLVPCIYSTKIKKIKITIS